MTTLLTLPREIRDLILRDAISLESSPPSAHSVSSGRERLLNDVDPYWTPTTNIYVEPGLDSSAQTALLQTCRQLRAETQYILETPDARPYRLDVLLVKECGLFPTWLSFPRHQKHIDELYVQMRVSDRPENINEEWLEAARYRGDSDGSARTCWNIMFLLSAHLLGGYHHLAALSEHETRLYHEEDEDDEFDLRTHKIATYTIKTLIIDVVAEPADGDEAEEGQAPRNAFGHYIFNTKVDFFFPDERVSPAHKLAFEVSNNLEMVLRFDYSYELYGRLLHENIGTLHIHINSVPWIEDNLTSRLCGEGFGTVLKSDPEWFERVVEKRRGDGLWDEEVYEELRERFQRHAGLLPVTVADS